MEEKKFIITNEQKELLLWNINNRALMDAKWIIRQLLEHKEEEKEVGKIEKELRMVYEFLKEQHPEILENVAKYVLLNVEELK